MPISTGLTMGPFACASRLAAPYFHNGLVKFIPEAVRVMAATQLNKSLSDDQVADITAFLESLTGEFPAQTMPRLPPTPGDMLE